MWRVAVLLLLGSLTFLTGLGRTAIQDSDEAYYAEAGREMLASGDWLIPTYNFEPRLNKPILLYWLIAGTYAVAGVGEAAARLWPALSGLGMALVAFLAGSRWIGPTPGLIAGVIVATSFGVVPFARQSLPDMPLAFFVSVSVWAAIEALAPPPDAAGRGAPQRWLYLSAVAAALGVLMKGPVALALLASVLLPLGLAEWREIRGRRLGSRLDAWHLAGAAALFVVIAAPWYVAVTHAEGVGYLRQFFIGENVDRFATSQYNTWRGHTYVPIIIGGLLPWSAFGLLWLTSVRDVAARRRRLGPVARRLLAWTLGPLAFFMLSIGSQPRYILPCLVPLALLLARTIWAHASRSAGRDPLFAAATLLAGASIVAAGALILRAGPLLAAARQDWSAAGPLAIVLGGAAVVIWAFAGSRRWTPAAIASAAALAMIVFEMSVLAPGRPEPVEVLARTIREHGGTAPVCACGALARSLTFYTHLKTYLAPTDHGDAEVADFLTTDRRLFAAVDAQVLARVEASLGRRFPRLVEVQYLSASVRQQPGTLLNPDPALVQRIVLVTTE